MSALFGDTRTRVAGRHALIAEDGHVASALPGFQGATPFFLISPEMGAALTQILIRFEEQGSALLPEDGLETALYVQSGSCCVHAGDEKRTVTAGDFAFVPADRDLQFSAAAQGTAVTCFRKAYEPLPGHETPPAVFGSAADIAGKPFLGNPRALLKTLLPDDFRFDLAMNIFTYEPGATLPFVETHIMEHGLLMLEGQGVYRLEEKYYPVKAGDVIWMAPYCPQWFVAMGDSPASYLYYKNVNRHA
ncbi:MAG TPA: (S)-ureidoglycine aminohydrolase [Terrimicrobiaceae bacterium]|nr:(S)-ureidoglycine aminohydrolase [Terrimicrobiaceae bacterium]